MSGNGDQNPDRGPREKKAKFEDMHDVLHRLKEENQKQIHNITKSIDQLISDKERVERALENVGNGNQATINGENVQNCIIKFLEE